MLIRDEQVRALDESTKKQFLVGVKEFVKSNFSELVQGLDDETLLNRISADNLSAARLGIKSQAGLARFTCLSLIFGTSFNDSAGIRNLISQTGESPERVLELLLTTCAKVAIESGKCNVTSL